MNFNAAQAAEYLHCSPKTVEELARDGKLPAVKIGRSWIFPESVLNEYIEHQARVNLKAKTVDPAGKYPVL